MPSQPHGRRQDSAADLPPTPRFAKRDVMPCRPVLIGDGIENPGNVEALQAVASLFAWDCAFLDGARAAGSSPATAHPGALMLSPDALTADFAPIIALENTADADDLYGFQPPPGARLALIVGNERKGISREVLDRAYQTVRIPMASQQINTVNVAAAAAIALYYLSCGGGGRLRTRPNPQRSRPELLIASPGDPIELGSVIRSAAAFGWQRLFVDDRHGAWFGTDRVTRSLGRGAARRGRNDIHVIPAAVNRPHGFAEACIVTAGGEGEPLDRVDLARGPEQLVMIVDPSSAEPAAAELAQLARRIRRVRLDFPGPRIAHNFRLTASIVLAEVARQVGIRQRSPRLRRPLDELSFSDVDSGEV